MIRLSTLLHSFRRDERGAMIIETAIVAPVLVLMSLGAFQVSQMVARQSELESAASEAAAIALASAPDNAAKRTTLQQVIMSSTNLSASNVAVTEVYRCNSNAAYVTALTSCTSGVVAKYVRIGLTDTYTPAWTRFGVGSPLSFRVNRYVMYKQQDAS